MGRPARQLSIFIVGLALSFGLLESLVRRNTALFEGASHRGLAKAAMYELRPKVDLLFLGTSRAQDGISPSLVSQALSERAPERSGTVGFNAAFTGSSLGDLTSLVERFNRRSRLEVVVIELSAPQIHNRPAAWDQASRASGTPGIEARLEAWVRRSQVVQYRTAFLPENLGRLPALLVFSDSLGGWETRGTDQLAAWMGKRETPAVGFNPALWVPEVVLPSSIPQPLEAVLDEAATRLAALARMFRQQQAEVVFAVPPLSRGHQPAPERDQLRPLFFEVARRAGCEVWNFAPLALPDGMFRDSSHLGRDGRAHYSKALGWQIAQRIKRT